MFERRSDNLICRDQSLLEDRRRNTGLGHTATGSYIQSRPDEPAFGGDDEVAVERHVRLARKSFAIDEHRLSGELDLIAGLGENGINTETGAEVNAGAASLREFIDHPVTWFERLWRGSAANHDDVVADLQRHGPMPLSKSYQRRVEHQPHDQQRSEGGADPKPEPGI